MFIFSLLGQNVDDDDDIEREINLMRQKESNDGTELDELVWPSTN